MLKARANEYSCHLGASNRQGVQTTSGPGYLLKDVAAIRVEHDICEVGVRLELQRPWRRGPAEGGAGGMRIQAS